MTAEERVEWALKEFGSRIVLASSFGVQSAVLLHLVTSQRPDIPVILIDTGYLFPETYQHIDSLTNRLALNLVVTRSEISPAWQETRYGRLWEQGLEGLTIYNRMNKIEPMQRALDDLGADAWFSGLRRSQSKSRTDCEIVVRIRNRQKIHPILDWSDRMIGQYLKKHDLLYHPLWERGYVSIGDVHSTRPLTEGMTEEETRFGGLTRECGLHIEDYQI